MCGIAGFISKQKDAPQREREFLLDRMCATIRHRGPDEQGTFVAGRAALGMRRLSIIDLKSGQQPIFSCDGNLAIVFNGEIYNFRELKTELENLGHRFKTNSDTETIVHAYEEFGEKCLDKLRGMFAFAIWDKRAEKLFLARDRVGKKPLFYAEISNNFVFGSELKVLLETGEIERKLNFTALDSYLTFGYVPDDLCIFENVHKLPAGHFLIFERGEIRIEQYWDFPPPSETKLNERETIVELQRLLGEAVKIRLVSEVPLGAFLSGGVDSSAIVGLMSRHVEQVKTFSIGFHEDSYNELKFARRTAEHFKTEHHEFTVTPEMVGEIDNLVEHFDEPFADMSALPMFFVAKLAREFVTVALSGDGGDELFAGYTRYATHQKRSSLAKLPRVLRQNVLQTVAANLPSGAMGKNYLHNASLDSLDRYIDSISHFGKSNRKQL